jgi:hypothetical protein
VDNSESRLVVESGGVPILTIAVSVDGDLKSLSRRLMTENVVVTGATDQHKYALDALALLKYKGKL